MRFHYLGLLIGSLILSTASYADAQREISYANMTRQPMLQLPSKSHQSTINISFTSQRDELITFAQSLIGTPYRYGGTTRNGFDCSGLVRYAFAHIGKKIPRVSSAQFKSLPAIDQPEVGDLVFFGHRGRVSHVGIYIGDGKMLHAPSSGKQVTIDSYTGGYWGKRYLGARRVLDDEPTLVAKNISNSSHKQSNRPSSHPKI